jgi:hypothetical protein
MILYSKDISSMEKFQKMKMEARETRGQLPNLLLRLRKPIDQ